MPEIIIPNKINPKNIISGKIDYLIRIGEKNKWTENSIFNLKTSHLSEPFTKIKIISSTYSKVTEIPQNILTRSGYSSTSDFYSQWEKWYQTLSDNSYVWLIHFEIYNPQPQKEINYMNLLA